MVQLCVWCRPDSCRSSRLLLRSQLHCLLVQAERLDVYPPDTIMGESLLGVELSETRGTLSGVLSYNKDIFRATSAQRIASHLEVRGLCPASAKLHPWLQLKHLEHMIGGSGTFPRSL